MNIFYPLRLPHFGQLTRISCTFWGDIEGEYWGVRKMKQCILLIMAMLLLNAAYAEDKAKPFAVTIHSDRDTFFLGEPIRINLCVKNISSETRFASYDALKSWIFFRSFDFSVIDEQGCVLEQPLKSPPSVVYIGNAPHTELKPGKEDVRPIDLNRYCYITKPGKYTVQGRKIRLEDWTYSGNFQSSSRHYQTNTLVIKVISAPKGWAEKRIEVLKQIIFEKRGAERVKPDSYQDWHGDGTYAEGGEFRQAVWELGYIGNTEAIEVLMTIVANTDRNISQVAKGALLLAQDKDFLFKSLIPAYKSDIEDAKSPFQQASSDNPYLSVLSCTGVRSNVPYLIPLLKEPDEKIRHAILQALMSTEDTRAYSAVVRQSKDKSPETRYIAAYALGRMGKDEKYREKIAKRLIKLFKSDADDNVRWHTIGILSFMKAKSAIPALRKALYDKNQNIAIKASEVLTGFGDADSFQLFLERLPNVSFEFQQTLLENLGKLDRQRAVPEIKRYLQHPNQVRALHAAYILYTLGDASGFELIDKALDSKDKNIQDKAFVLLHKLSGKHLTFYEYITADAPWRTQRTGYGIEYKIGVQEDMEKEIARRHEMWQEISEEYIRQHSH